MSRRRYTIIAVLTGIGVASLAAKVCLEPDYEALEAALDLGVEMLPAAILFILINSLIDRYEHAQASRREAMRTLRGDGPSSATSLLNLLAHRGVLRLGDLSSGELQHVELRDLKIREGRLDHAELNPVYVALAERRISEARERRGAEAEATAEKGQAA